jgi:hypothetical protein
LFAASAGITEVVAKSKEVAANKVALLPSVLNERRTTILP